jgi:hypothetical protein
MREDKRAERRGERRGERREERREERGERREERGEERRGEEYLLDCVFHQVLEQHDVSWHSLNGIDEKV